jgi:hypothetical protein
MSPLLLAVLLTGCATTQVNGLCVEQRGALLLGGLLTGCATAWVNGLYVEQRGAKT